MLGAFSYNVALSSSQEYAGSNPYGFVVRVVHQWIQGSGSGIAGISEPGQELAHVGVDDFVAAVSGADVTLVAVAEVQQIELVQVIFRDGGIQFGSGVTVCPIRGCSNLNLFACNQVLYHVTASILIRLSFRHHCGAYIEVNSRAWVADFNVVYPCSLDFDGGICVPKIYHGS